MFGSKKEKCQRQQRIIQLLEQHPHGLTVPELCRFLKVASSTMLRDLPDLETQGIYLDEADNRLRIAFRDW